VWHGCVRWQRRFDSDELARVDVLNRYAMRRWRPAGRGRLGVERVPVPEGKLRFQTGAARP
jgi:hypothetical protein